MIRAICWVLIHSLWQGALFTVITGCIVLCMKRSAVEARYRVLCTLFLLFLATCGLTLVYELCAQGASVHIVRFGEEGSVLLPAGLLPAVSGLGRYLTNHAALIVLTWLMVFSIKCVRLARGWNYAQRIRLEAILAPAVWSRRIRLFSRQMGISRRVSLVQSKLVRVPVVIGFLRPVICIPLGLLNHLPADEMEAVLLHEMAHIRRNDYLVHLLQHVAESMFFFNPGLLWLSSLLREEREHCCDDMAITITHDRIGFVRALVRFKEYALAGGAALVGGAALAFPAGKHQLLKRVLRITNQEFKVLGRGEKIFLLGSCLLALALPSLVHGPRKAAVDHSYTVAPLKYTVEPFSKPAAVDHSVIPKGNEEEISAYRRGFVREDSREVQHDRRNTELADKEADDAVQDRTQAVKDLVQTERDQQQMLRDRDQLLGDKGQSVNNDEQAIKDKQQAEVVLRARLEEIKNLRAQAAELNRREADLEKAKAEIDRMVLQREKMMHYQLQREQKK